MWLVDLGVEGFTGAYGVQEFYFLGVGTLCRVVLVYVLVRVTEVDWSFGGVRKGRDSLERVDFIALF